ncbi:MAG: hemolysin family protein [Myxococcota bacterium]|nr:hemolysin family protein [Myxococcota bacterium]
MTLSLWWLAHGSALASTGTSGPVVDAAVVSTAVLCIVLLCCSAFFSSSETALFGLQPVDIESMNGRGKKHVRDLLAEPRNTLASILIGNETVNIALSTVSAGLLLRLFPDQPWLNIVVVAPMLLVFGEVLPKTFAFRFAPVLAPRSALVLTRFATVVAPIRFVLSRLADAALVLTGGSKAPRQAELREAHLRALIDQSREEGNIRAMEREILHRVFEFGDLTVKELMTRREDVVSVSLLTPWDELVAAVQTQGLSRIPVWQGSPNNIVGILLVKRLLGLVSAQRLHGRTRSPSPRQIHKLLHPPRFVPQTKAADDLLAEFQARRSHMAVVVDEKGDVVGVVTLDDLLEELVGEMNDETDKEDPAVTPVEAQTWNVRGDMSIADFAERFHMIVPDAACTTLAGLVQHVSGGPLVPGTEVDWNGVRFQINNPDPSGVHTITVEMEQAYEEDEPTQESDLGPEVGS